MANSSMFYMSGLKALQPENEAEH